MIKHKTVPVRKVASFVGQVISISTVIGSVCQLMTRCIGIMTYSWNACIQLSVESMKQIQF